MSSDFRPSVAALFSEAIGLPEGERTAFLARVCSGNEHLRSELESLLDADSRAGGFLQDDAAQVLGLAPSDDPADVNAGRRIGAYRIVEPIGRGGMGTVYRAERVDAAYRVQVAIKLIRRGMDTDDILRRFRRERQVLARLQHPNIARLIDGGSLEDGLPYIVMEYVEGIAIDRFCDERGLGIRERIQLFRSVCGAVEYAHGQLIVHRDLKPSNILVDNQGQARLLDFGIAKLLAGQDDEPDAPEPTIPSLRLMTPHYSSPEQIHGRPVTTATDVYSLGVVLYRLLTGRVPFAQRNRSPAALGRSVRAEEAIRPSVASRGDPVLVRVEGGEQRLKRRLAGDLDTIVLTALSSEAEHRYHSVHEFSEDLRRHLENLPIQAGRPTLRYRVSRFARRHRASLAAGAAVVSTLAVATALSTSLYFQARSARDEARRQNEVAVEVSRFLGQTFAAVDPHVAQGRDVSVLRELLDSAEGRIADEITPGTEVAAALHLTLGKHLPEPGRIREGGGASGAGAGDPRPDRASRSTSGGGQPTGPWVRSTGRRAATARRGPHLVRAMALMDSAGDR